VLLEMGTALVAGKPGTTRKNRFEMTVGRVDLNATRVLCYFLVLG
jgi:hypothetical protein